MEQKKLPKIAFICNSTAARLWRILPVSDHFRDIGYEVVVFDIGSNISIHQMYALVDNFDIFVLQMIFDEKLVSLIKGAGKKYVFEMDDLITWVPKDHYARKTMKDNWFRWTIGCWKAIRKADAVTASTPFLAKYYNWLRLGKTKINVLPNYMEDNFWFDRFRSNKTDTIRIGYVGGSSHKDDLKVLINPLKRIMAEYPNVQFVTMGTGGYSSEDNELTEWLHGEDLFKELPRGRRQHYLGVTMGEYPKKLRSLDLDIGLAPLKDNKFTRAKTPIKWMEYTSCQVAFVGERFLYSQIVDDKVTGLLAHTEDEYYDCIKLLIEDKQARQEMAAKAYQKLKDDYLFSKHAYKWVEVYSNIF